MNKLQNLRLREIEESLPQLMQLTLESTTAHGIQLALQSPELGLEWQDAIGFSSRQESHQRVLLSVDQPMRIASTTKTFVATAILRLWEEQSVGLDHAIECYLSAQHSDLIKSAGYKLSDITIRHLLSHTSGLRDYGNNPEFLKAIFEMPDDSWTRSEQLQIAMAAGQPFGKPGEVFCYCDTGYILLGEIIEQISGLDLGTALRHLLDYDCLGLHSTWFESSELAPIGSLPLVHQYEGDIDSYQLDASCDSYGGGGLVSTVGDMARFMGSLFKGCLFKHTFTLPIFLSTVAATSGGPDYGVWEQVPGTYRLGIDGGKTGRVFSHKGHFGTVAAYVPELDLAVGLSLNFARQGNDPDCRDCFLNQILSLFEFNP